MTRVLVIGYGSIGQRHARLLDALGCEVAVASRRPVAHPRRYASAGEALAGFRPDYVVVANETAAHAASVQALLAGGFSGALLVEKPYGGPPPAALRLAAVGYNLRFHPALVALAEALAGERLVGLQVYCGQYLPDWRPGTDYRASYSADPARGGGVLRDLSHDIDILLWLGGACRRLAALGGRLGPLEIASDDAWGVLAELERCPVATLQVNYLDRPGRRQVTAVTATHTYVADLGRGVLVRDGEERSFAVDRDATYLAQHRAVLAGDAARLCSFTQGERVMRFIAAAERAAGERAWIGA